MNQTIDLVTDGQPQVTSKAAAILTDIIRQALADQRREPPTIEAPVERRS